MAVDTRDKRASAVGIGLPFRVLPSPDSSIGAADRLHLGFLYRGIAAEDSTAGVFDEQAIESSLLYYFQTNVAGVSSIDYDEHPFDLEQATESVEIDVLFTRQRPRRSGTPFNIHLEVVFHCWAKFGDERHRVHQLVDSCVAAMSRRAISVYDYDFVAEPKVGIVRLNEPQIRNLTREHNEANFTGGGMYRIRVEGVAEPC